MNKLEGETRGKGEWKMFGILKKEVPHWFSEAGDCMLPVDFFGAVLSIDIFNQVDLMI